MAELVHRLLAGPAPTEATILAAREGVKAEHWVQVSARRARRASSQ